MKSFRYRDDMKIDWLDNRFARRLHDPWFGMLYLVMASLIDGPQDLQGISDNFNAYLRRLGLFAHVTYMHHVDHEEWHEQLNATLAVLIARGWVSAEGDKYTLTTLGRRQTEDLFKYIHGAKSLFDRLIQPKSVSILAVAAHLTLAAIKLPIALISGSVGLLNDSLDTLMDAMASILVFLGIQFNKERYVNYTLVAMMLGVGVIAFFESASHILYPVEPAVDTFTFIAVIASAVICAFLFLYQRYVGLQSCNLNLITQSVDARNHIIVAASVAVGLICAVLHFGLLDALVGLGVAILILKSGVELLFIIIRSRPGRENIDLSMYERSFNTLGEYQNKEMREWMLYLVDSGRILTKDELFLEIGKALDYDHNAVLRELDLNKNTGLDVFMGRCFEELVGQGFLSVENGLALKDKGRKHLGMIMKKAEMSFPVQRGR